MTYHSQPRLVPLNYCNSMTCKIYLAHLKPIKLNKIGTEELSIIKHKLNQYSEESWTLHTFSCLLISPLQCWWSSLQSSSWESAADDQIASGGPSNSRPPPDPKRIPVFRKILPRTRPSIQAEEQQQLFQQEGCYHIRISIWLNLDNFTLVKVSYYVIPVEIVNIIQRCPFLYQHILL